MLNLKKEDIIMGKHDEYEHTLSPSKQLSFCFQVVYCGNDDYLIIKTADNNMVIYAELYLHEYTDWPYGTVYWDENADTDTLVDDQIYLFLEVDDKLVLLDGLDHYDRTKTSVNDLLEQAFSDSPVANNEGEHVLMEHRLVKYKRDLSQNMPRSYKSINTTIEFNCEMVVVEDVQGPLLKRWKAQDKLYRYKRIYEDGSFIWGIEPSID